MPMLSKAKAASEKKKKKQAKASNSNLQEQEQHQQANLQAHTQHHTHTHTHLPPHLLPIVPILPPFDSVPNAGYHIRNLLHADDGKISSNYKYNNNYNEPIQHTPVHTRTTPTMAGITALLQRFIAEIHSKNKERIRNKQDGHRAVTDFYEAINKHIRPFDERYLGAGGLVRNNSNNNNTITTNNTANNTTNTNNHTAHTTRHLFPVREDGSLFVSIAAFREPLLKDTLVSAFEHAKYPEKLFVGVVVQNCFGDDAYANANANMYNNNNTNTNTTNNNSNDYKPCLTGPLIVGTKSNGKPKRVKLPAPPDANGVRLFCDEPGYRTYCLRGNVRVLYLHDTDSLGPSMARYYASKLWGGENYFVQIDAHLKFATNWDKKFVDELKATSSYPKSILSTYPPGFGQIRFIPKHMHIDPSTINETTPVIESPGCRLCACTTPSGERNPILHIQQGRNYQGNETRPTQTPFLGAGLIVAHADFLSDVPFDPYLPWTFMGEEILLSMRAWTNGWNMYAPRKNLVLHHYRQGVLGIPKFFGTVNAE